MLLVLFLIAPMALPVPLARAQSGTAAPPAAPAAPADPPYPFGAVIESIPPDAIVLSLDETIRMSLENNLAIIVQRYQPRTTATFVDVERSAFDPLVNGSVARDSDDRSGAISFQQPVGTPNVETEHSTTGTDYLATWIDPLTIGGSYKIDVGKSSTDDDSGSFVPAFNTFFADTTKSDSTYWRVSYSQSLLRNLGRDVNLWPTVVAQKGLAISESTFRQTVIDIVATAERYYWELNFAIMQVRTERFSLKLAQDFLEQNRIKVRVGTLAPIEITQAEAGVADRMETVIIFEAALRAAEDQIRRVVGVRSDSRDWDRPVRPSDTLRLAEIEVDEDAAMQLALANRPDLEQARLQIEARDTEARARKNLRRWGLEFQGSYGSSDPTSHETQSLPLPTIESKSDGTQTTWGAALTLSVPIHNRLAIANVTRTENELAQAQYQLQLVEQTARVEISSAVRAVRTTLARVQAGQVNVRLQHEKLAAEQKKFENGMSTSFQVLQFQDDLASAETRENLAKADYNKAQVELSRVKGTILAELGILLAPAAGTGDAAQAQSAALRTLWSNPSDLWSDPGLRLAERTADTVRLPTAFAFAPGTGGAARGPATTDWIGAATGGR
jgi:outer membrane protein TolC